MLRANSSVPLYKQLYQQLRDAIEHGDFQVGEKFPSEREMAAYYGISRPTVRKAFDILRREGYLHAYQGRGCFIAEAERRAANDKRLPGLSELMLEQGVNPTSRVLSRRIVRADSEVAQHLDIETHRKVIQVRRLRLANDLPIAIHTAYLPLPLCSSLLDANLEKNSLYRALEEIPDVHLAYASQTIQSILGCDSDLPLLGMRPPAAVLQLQRNTYDTHDRSVEYLHAIYRDGPYRIGLDPQIARN